MQLIVSEPALPVRVEPLAMHADDDISHLEAIDRAFVAMDSTKTIQEMLSVLADESARILNAAAVTIWLHDSRKDELYQAAASGFPSLSLRLRPGQGIAGRVYCTGEPHISRDFKNDPGTDPAARWQVPAGLSGAAVPIRSGQRVVGVFFVSVVFPRELSTRQIRVLNILSGLAGIAIHRMQLQENTEQRLERFSSLRMVDGAIASGLDPKLVLTMVLDQIVTQPDVDAAAVLLLDPHTRRLESMAFRGFRSAGLGQWGVTLGEGIFGRAAADQKSVYFPDLMKMGERVGLQLLSDERFAAAFAVPLVVRGQLSGLLCVFQRTRVELDQETRDWFGLLARQAAIVTDDASRPGGAARSNVDTDVTVDEILEAWSRALDLRENEPEGHSSRLAELAVRLARALGLDEAQVRGIRRGALLHDVGMLAIPDSLRLKEGALSQQEWQAVRRHPVHAYNLLEPAAGLRGAVDIPYCHHEKWNGSGYPNRLSGEDIPLAARIFAVVDVWCAMRSDRPYRRAWPEGKVRERLRALSGVQFDPKVVEAFLKLVEKWQPRVSPS